MRLSKFVMFSLVSIACSFSIPVYTAQGGGEMPTMFDFINAGLAGVYEERIDKVDQQINALNEKIRHATSDVERESIKSQIDGLIQQKVSYQKAMEGQVGKVGEKQNLRAQAAKAFMKGKALGDAQGKQIAKAIIKSVQQIVSPKTAAIIIAIIGSTYGIKYLTQYIYDSTKMPTLAQETSIESIFEKLLNWFNGKEKPSSNINDVILFPSLQARIDKLANSIKYIVANGGCLPHVLFYGPPGTGKTMLAQRISRHVGLHYVYISGADLHQYSEEEMLKKVRDQFAFARNSGKKLLLVIDECELVFAQRSSTMSERAKKLLSLILTLTGDTENRDCMIVGITNRIQDFDEASLSRFSIQMFIGTPALEERILILNKYVDYFLTSTKSFKRPKLSFWQKLFGRRVTVPKKITIEEGALSDERLADIAMHINGFSGRDISKMILEMQMTALATKQAQLTIADMDEIIAQKIAQHAGNSSLHAQLIAHTQAA